MRWLAEAREHGKFNLSVYPTVAVQPVDNARNEIVRTFLKSDCTHLLFIDSDTMPPPDAIEKLLKVNQPIVSGLTPIIELDEKTRDPWRKWNCVGYDGNHVKPHTGILPIKGAGSSCILIRREVFEKIPDPWYRFVYEDDNGKKVFNGEPLIISEDVHFIMQAVSRQIPAFCDTSIICGHNKNIIF
jgi:cellulose synthase/poly-beta-1,6-N-acetylglucosamine synthase-like glycosyltransferase